MSEVHCEASRFDAKKIALLAVLALAGGAVGWSVAEVTRGRDLSWPDELAGLIALMCLAMAAVSTFVAWRRPGSLPLKVGRLQSASLALAGALLLLPMLAPSEWPRAGVLAALVALGAVQLAANLRLWRTGDELFRRVILETGAVCFWLLQLALFAYAAAERLGLVGTVSAWGLMGVLMAVYLVASGVVAYRRGLG